MDESLLICPLCAQGVRLLPTEDPNITWDIHFNCECDPSNHQKQAKKRCCPVAACNESLLFSNTIRCKNCNQDHCLKHKFAPDHNCAGPKKPEPGFPFLDAFKRSRKCEIPMINSSPKLGLNFLNAATSIITSAEAGMQKLSIATNEALRKAKGGIAQARGDSGDGLAERCLQCPRKFSDVKDLIEHAEKVHQCAVRPALDVMVIEVCPNCGKSFGDPVLLVSHFEVEHGNSC